MAPESSRPYCSSCQNLPPFDPVKNELTRDPDPVRGPHSGSTSSVPSRNLTPGPDLVPALVPALIPVLVPTSAPALAATNDLFRQFMKAYLKSNQRPRQPPAKREQPFKAKISKLYYSKLHMDCYHFCQQCKDHFEIAEATRANWTPFAVFFLCKNISVR